DPSPAVAVRSSLFGIRDADAAPIIADTASAQAAIHIVFAIGIRRARSTVHADSRPARSTRADSDPAGAQSEAADTSGRSTGRAAGSNVARPTARGAFARTSRSGQHGDSGHDAQMKSYGPVARS